MSSDWCRLLWEAADEYGDDGVHRSLQAILDRHGYQAGAPPGAGLGASLAKLATQGMGSTPAAARVEAADAVRNPTFVAEG